MPNDTDRLARIENLLTIQVNGHNEHWHVKKEVTVAHILTTLGAIVLILTAWFSVRGDVQSLQSAIAHPVSDARVTSVERDVVNMRSTYENTFTEIKTELRSINDKLDEKEDRPRIR
jgi:hypothetical protein